MNKTQVRQLLIIEDPEKETIYGVIGRMEVLIDFFKQDSQYHGLLPFLMTYYLVTKLVADKYIHTRHYFSNMKAHEMLEVHFASLYFKPLLVFLETGEGVAPWKTYFEYSQNPKGLPFAKMLLGINAHINTDLYLSLIHLDYHYEKDYFLINRILQELIPDVMQYLVVTERDLLGVSGLVLKDFITAEFHNVIERWRLEAWVNAQLTTARNSQRMRRKMIRNTEELGKRLITDFTNISHFHNPYIALKDVNSLSVNFHYKDPFYKQITSKMKSFYQRQFS
jgi:hypothetical protein